MDLNITLRSLRLSDELYLKLQYIAKLEKRSFNLQATYVLETYVKNYEEINGVIKVDEEDLYL